jgi:hypothetical protein
MSATLNQLSVGSTPVRRTFPSQQFHQICELLPITQLRSSDNQVILIFSWVVDVDCISISFSIFHSGLDSTRTFRRDVFETSHMLDRKCPVVARCA